MLKQYRNKGLIEAVQFTGSTTQMNNIQKWVDGGEYPPPDGIETADIREHFWLELPHHGGAINVGLWYYVVKIYEANGRAQLIVLTPGIFEDMYEEI